MSILTWILAFRQLVYLFKLVVPGLNLVGVSSKLRLRFEFGLLGQTDVVIDVDVDDVERRSVSSVFIWNQEPADQISLIRRSASMLATL